MPMRKKRPTATMLAVAREFGLVEAQKQSKDVEPWALGMWSGVAAGVFWLVFVLALFMHLTVYSFKLASERTHSNPRYYPKWYQHNEHGTKYKGTDTANRQVHRL